jgi:hypothetical protein
MGKNKRKNKNTEESLDRASKEDKISSEKFEQIQD